MKKEYPNYRKSSSNKKCKIDTLPDEKRFKEERRLAEMRNIGPGAYYNDGNAYRTNAIPELNLSG